MRNGKIEAKIYDLRSELFSFHVTHWTNFSESVCVCDRFLNVLHLSAVERDENYNFADIADIIKYWSEYVAQKHYIRRDVSRQIEHHFKVNNMKNWLVLRAECKSKAIFTRRHLKNCLRHRERKK